MFWIVVLIYMSITLYVGYSGYKKVKGSDDFMLAGRKARPFIIGLSYGATFISTSAIVGFGGLSAQLGMGMIWLTVLNIGVGILVAFLVFGKRANALGHKLKAVTLPDLLGKRYNSPFMQYGPAVVILSGMPLYAAAVMLGGVRFIQTTLGVQFEIALLAFVLVTAVYVIGGGLIAVMYTDAMQGAIVVSGMTFLLVFTIFTLGGIPAATTQLTDMSSLVPSALAGQGMTGWTSFPSFGSPIWLTTVTTVILGVGIGVLAEPQLAIRFLTAKDEKHLKRAIPIGGVFVLLTTGVAFTVGPLTNVYFYQNTGNISLVEAAGNVDKIMPMYINSATPDLFIAVFMIVLLAAAMSALSSIFHTMGTAAGFDLWNHLRKKLRPEAGKMEIISPKATVLSSRVGMIIMISISVVLAYIMPPSIIARATVMFMGLMACAVLPSYAHALFTGEALGPGCES